MKYKKSFAAIGLAAALMGVAQPAFAYTEDSSDTADNVAASNIDLLSAPSDAVAADANAVDASTDEALRDYNGETQQVPCTGNICLKPGKVVYQCHSDIDYPHNSKTPGVVDTVNTHVKDSCTGIAAHSVTGSLYRQRWFGYEHLLTKRDSSGKNFIKLNMAKKCTHGDDYYYQTAGRFYAISAATGRPDTISYYNAHRVICGVKY